MIKQRCGTRKVMLLLMLSLLLFYLSMLSLLFFCLLSLLFFSMLYAVNIVVVLTDAVGVVVIITVIIFMEMLAKFLMLRLSFMLLSA